jgi:hypothetical protein
MAKHDFPQILSGLDKTTAWFLNEIVYCLEHYAGLSEEKAQETILSSYLMKLLRRDDSQRMWREPAFHWAMCILHGFDSYWWHDEKLMASYDEYVRERHHPPIGE